MRCGLHTQTMQVYRDQIAMRTDEKLAPTLNWNKKAAGWWSADYKGYKLQVCEEKQPMHPPAFLVYIDGRRMGPTHASLSAAQAAASNLID